jgi:pimeloyl-ACP methyl ester carboxylesterase
VSAATGTFTTSDGVDLAYERDGAGPLLVLAHGGATDRRCFEPVLDRFAEGFAVVAYDRRGHGDSGDGDATTYSLEREAGDLRELVAHLDEGDGACVVAYSFGALVALHAAAGRRAPIHALVAYEPPFGVPGMLPADDEVLRLVAEGRHDEAARTFVATTFHLSATAVDAMTRHPMWDVTVALMPTLPREAPVLAATPVRPLGAMPPTRVLLAAEGGNPAFRAIAAELREVIDDCDVATVPGLPHFAIATAPDAFVAAAVEHLRRVHPGEARP